MTGTASGEETAAMTTALQEGDFGRAAETPSGKGAGDENFPVGSWLLPARLRPHVAKFYAFARAIDDIADNPELTPEDKIRRLDRFEDAITGRETEDPALMTAHRLRASLAETGVTARHWDQQRAFLSARKRPVSPTFRKMLRQRARRASRSTEREEHRRRGVEPGIQPARTSAGGPARPWCRVRGRG